MIVERSPLLAKSARNGSTRQGRFDLRKESQKILGAPRLRQNCISPTVLCCLRRSSARRDAARLPAEIYLKADAWIELQFCLVGERNAHYVEIIESLDAKIKRITLRDRAATGLKAKNVSLRDVFGNVATTSLPLAGTRRCLSRLQTAFNRQRGCAL